MMKSFEEQYMSALTDIRNYGHMKKGRNGWTKGVHGLQFRVDVSDRFPILTARKMYWKGIAGEYAAFIRQPNHVEDFEEQGCNFWKPWANDGGFINVDYGNAWIDYNDTNQMEQALNMLKTNPGSRRILIDSWRPDRQNDLSLPCCHYSYQFLCVRDNLDLIWTQRSGDMAVGIPSDIISATIMLNQFADLSGLKPRYIIMNIADAHIYEEHDRMVHFMLYYKWSVMEKRYLPPKYKFKKQTDLYSFTKDDIELINYKHHDPIRFEIKE